MKWKKLGLVFCASNHSWWMKSHAMIPIPTIIQNRLIVFLSFCDDKGIARPGYVELNIENPLEVLSISQEPLVDLGRIGTFDESGVLACSVLVKNNKYYMYYAGFELGTKIRYRLLTGLAIGDQIDAFKKVSNTPILERSDRELYFRCGPFVLFENEKYKMWYVAGSDWQDINGKAMPVYTINYIESDDGINWPNHGKTCIDIEHEEEHGFGRPYVTKIKENFYMFFSVRIKNLGYRLGYAISKDGVNWIRKYDLNLETSNNKSDFDSEAISYTAIIEIRGKIYMFYNGNEFGKTGFGAALLEEL